MWKLNKKGMWVWKQPKPKTQKLVWTGYGWTVKQPKSRKPKMNYYQALAYAGLPQDQFQAITGISWKKRLAADLF